MILRELTNWPSFSSHKMALGSMWFISNCKTFWWNFIQLEKGQEHQVVCVRFIERKVQDLGWSWTLFTPCESHVSQPSEQVFLSCVSNTSVCCPYFLTLPCFAFSIAKKLMWLVLSDLKVWWKFIHWIIQYESVWSSAEILWHLCSVRHCYTQMH